MDIVSAAFQSQAGRVHKEIKEYLFTNGRSGQQESTAAEAGQGLFGNGTGKAGSCSSIKGIAAVFEDYCCGLCNPFMPGCNDCPFLYFIVLQCCCRQ